VAILTQAVADYLKKNNMMELIIPFKVNAEKIENKKIITYPFTLKDDIKEGI